MDLRGTWGRWRWADTGWGKWHAIADAGVDTGGHAAVRLACGRDRHLPNEILAEGKPTENVCPECVTFDDMRRRWIPETIDVDTREPVPA